MVLHVLCCVAGVSQYITGCGFPSCSFDYSCPQPHATQPDGCEICTCDGDAYNFRTSTNGNNASLPTTTLPSKHIGSFCNNEIKTSCYLHCEHGYNYDSNGCFTCDCSEVCEITSMCGIHESNTNCYIYIYIYIYGFTHLNFQRFVNNRATCDMHGTDMSSCRLTCPEFERNAYGCLKCDCKPSNECPEQSCEEHCTNGFM